MSKDVLTYEDLLRYIQKLSEQKVMRVYDLHGVRKVWYDEESATFKEEGIEWEDFYE